MAKLAIFFLVAVAFQASFAVPTYYEDNTLFKYLNEIRSEVQDITLYLEKDFPEDRLAHKTVTWQCQKLVEAIQVIINKLHEETFSYQSEGVGIFREVVSLLKEVRDSLKQITLYNEITNIHEVKKNFIVSINLVLERFEKLVQLTYKLYPEFQYTLKYLFVDFLTTLRGIRSHFIHINEGLEVVKTPRVLIKEIHEYTNELTQLLQEVVHPTQIKVALREYLIVVNEIVRKLQQETILGHKELDLVLHQLTNKLREIVYPIMEIMAENTVDVKVFRTKIISNLREVVAIFEQLVQLCEDKVLPVEIRTLLVRVIYHYFYAVKHVIQETRFGNKIGFYTPKYYSTEYYGKHGYGLFEKEIHNRFYTPYKYETNYEIPFEYKNIEKNYYNPYRYETLFPIRKFEAESIYGKALEWNKYESNVAVPSFNEGNTLFKYLNQIRSEVQDITLYLEKDFPEDRLALKTVTWQSHKLVEAIEVIINKLHEETFTYQTEIFREVVSLLKEVRDSLKQFTVYNEITNIHEIKKNFIVSINVVLERFEKLVNITYKLYPEFQYTLKYLFVDFVNTLHGIRSHFIHINEGLEVVQTPRVLIKQIHDYTNELTQLLQEFVHPTQIKVALREYLIVVNEIVRKLQEETVLGHKELDLVLHQLTNKLREIVYPIMEIMTENTVDVKVFRTKIITNLREVVAIFEQLVQLCEDKVLPVEIKTLLVRVIYHYFYAAKHVIQETRFGNKIGFYTPKYYSTEFYGKHGYGLYEKEFHNRFYTPYQYETKYYNIPFEYKNIENNYYNPYSYETLFPVHQNQIESFYGKNLQWNKYESPKDLVLTVQMLVKRIFNRFEQNTWEVTDVNTVLLHNIREFINVLDNISEKFENKMTFERSLHTEKYVEEFIYRIKEIKRELKQTINTEVFTNLPELKIRFLRYIEVVAAEYYKLIENQQVYGLENFLIKDIFNKFISFLNKVSYERNYISENYPIKGFNGFSSKYYKDNTIVPYNYNVYSHKLPFVNGGWLNYNTERFVPTVYNQLY
ncbi:uncharacterized protein LOC116173981 [Photinus pyralis]|nr:uncharacterized protein LOC116173981 [Photinus pyralis]